MAFMAFIRSFTSDVSKMKIIYVLLFILYVKLAVARSFAAGEDYTRQKGGPKGKRPNPFIEKEVNSNITTTEWFEKETEPNLLNPRTEPIWEFEDIDYSTVIGPLNKEYQDCYGLNIRCLLDRSHVRPICVYHHRRAQERYTSQCEMDYRNCMERVYKKGFPTYGVMYKDDREFYGEGYRCEESYEFKG